MLCYYLFKRNAVKNLITFNYLCILPLNYEAGTFYSHWSNIKFILNLWNYVWSIVSICLVSVWRQTRTCYLCTVYAQVTCPKRGYPGFLRHYNLSYYGMTLNIMSHNCRTLSLHLGHFGFGVSGIIWMATNYTEICAQ